MSWEKLEIALAGAGERGDDEHAQRPEIGHLVPAPGEPESVLARPPAAPEQHPLAGMDLVQRPLQALAVQPAQRPGRLGAGRPSASLTRSGM